MEQPNNLPPTTERDTTSATMEHNTVSNAATEATTATSVSTLLPHYIVCERGGLSNFHAGNIEYIDRIEAAHRLFQSFKRGSYTKAKFISDFIVRLEKDGYRFMKRGDGSQRCDICKKGRTRYSRKRRLPCSCIWKEISNEEATLKVGRCFSNLSCRLNKPKRFGNAVEYRTRRRISRAVGMSTNSVFVSNRIGDGDESMLGAGPPLRVAVVPHSTRYAKANKRARSESNTANGEVGDDPIDTNMQPPKKRRETARVCASIKMMMKKKACAGKKDGDGTEVDSSMSKGLLKEISDCGSLSTEDQSIVSSSQGKRSARSGGAFGHLFSTFNSLATGASYAWQKLLSTLK